MTILAATVALLVAAFVILTICTGLYVRQLHQDCGVSSTKMTNEEGPHKHMVSYSESMIKLTHIRVTALNNQTFIMDIRNVY